MRTKISSKTIASIVAGITVGLTAWAIFGSAPAEAQSAPTCCSGAACDASAGPADRGSGTGSGSGSGSGSAVVREVH